MFVGRFANTKNIEIGTLGLDAEQFGRMTDVISSATRWFLQKGALTTKTQSLSARITITPSKVLVCVNYSNLGHPNQIK